MPGGTCSPMWKQKIKHNIYWTIKVSLFVRETELPLTSKLCLISQEINLRLKHRRQAPIDAPNWVDNYNRVIAVNLVVWANAPQNQSKKEAEFLFGGLFLGSSGIWLLVPTGFWVAFQKPLCSDLTLSLFSHTSMWPCTSLTLLSLTWLICQMQIVMDQVELNHCT